MKLYGHPMSTCTRKVLTTLAEKGHEAEFHLVDLMKGEHKHEAHVAHQPFGRVPALEDHNFWLYESRAIIRYLDEKLEGGHKLTPHDIHDRAHMEQWMSVEYSYFSPHAMKIVGELLMKKMRGLAPDMDAVKAAREPVAHALDVADKHLAHHHYFGGKTFSLADISWMPYVQYLVAAEQGELITSRHGVNAWWERVSTRPSWKKVAG
jgi:glutathione S-transferase